MTSNLVKSNPTTFTTEDLDATVAAKGATERDRSAPDGRKGAGRCLREVLEDEVDDEGDVQALVVGGHDDAVRALAARRRLHGRPTGHSTGSLPSPQASAPSEPRWVAGSGTSGSATDRRRSQPAATVAEEDEAGETNKTRQDGRAQAPMGMRVIGFRPAQLSGPGP